MPKSPVRYPDAFRAEAVELVRAGERSLPQIARDLGINDQTLRNWVKRAEVDAGRGDVLAEVSRSDLEPGRPQLVEELGVDQVDLAQVGRVGVLADAGAVLHGGALVGVALDAAPGEQPDAQPRRLAEPVALAQVHRRHRGRVQGVGCRRPGRGHPVIHVR